jgi:UDP-glucose 4-epimerase
VVDLAQGHVAALTRLEGVVAINLGTGRGHSVLEMVQALSQVVGRSLPYIITEHRPGDIACCYAAVDRATELLGWCAERDLAAMCRDGWAWQAPQKAAD